MTENLLSHFNDNAYPFIISTQHFYVVVWLGTILAAFLTILRTLLQYKHNETLYLNDYLITLALLFQVALSILYTVFAPLMYEVVAVAAFGARPAASVGHSHVQYVKFSFAADALFLTAVWTVKLAMLAFFWRLLKSVRTKARVLWWAMSSFTIATWIVFACMQNLACVPLNKTFTPGGCLSPQSVRNSSNSFIFTNLIDLFTDVFIMIIPFALLFRLQITQRQKYILIALFLFPMVVIVFSALRLGLLARKFHPRSDWIDPIGLCLFSTLEISTAIIAACLPSLRLFFAKQPPTSDHKHHQTPQLLRSTTTPQDRSKPLPPTKPARPFLRTLATIFSPPNRTNPIPYISPPFSAQTTLRHEPEPPREDYPRAVLAHKPLPHPYYRDSIILEKGLRVTPRSEPAWSTDSVLLVESGDEDESAPVDLGDSGVRRTYW